jgi:hypothetical protein
VGMCVRGAGVPSQAWPCLKPQETFGRDSAAMEEACAKITSTHSECGTIESAGIQQSENIVLSHLCNPAPASNRE